MPEPLNRPQNPFRTGILYYKNLIVSEGSFAQTIELDVEFYKTDDDTEPTKATIDLNMYLGWHEGKFNIWPKEGEKGGFYAKAKADLNVEELRIGIVSPKAITSPEKAGDKSRKSVLKLLKPHETELGMWCLAAWIDMDVFLNLDSDTVTYNAFHERIDNSLLMYYLDGTTLRGLALNHSGEKKETSIDLAKHYKYDSERKEFSAMDQVDESGTLDGLKIEVFNSIKGYFLVAFQGDDTEEKGRISLSRNVKNKGGKLKFDGTPDTEFLHPEGKFITFTRDKPVISAVAFWCMMVTGNTEAAKAIFADGGIATIVMAGSIFAGAVGGIPGAMLFAAISTPIAALIKEAAGDTLVADRYLLQNYDLPELKHLIFDTVQNTMDSLIGGGVGAFYGKWTKAFAERTSNYTVRYAIQQGDVVIDFVRSLGMNTPIDIYQSDIMEELEKLRKSSVEALNRIGLNIED